jgi:hypothetical protein
VPPLVLQAHPVQGLQRPAAALGLSDPGVHQGDLHIFHQIQLGQQVVLLKDKAQQLVADFGQLVFVHLAHIPAVQQIGPLRGDVQTADDVHAGGLAGAGGAYNGHELPPADLKGDVVRCHHGGVPHVVVLAHLLKLNERLHVKILPVRRPMPPPGIPPPLGIPPPDMPPIMPIWKPLSRSWWGYRPRVSPSWRPETSRCSCRR